MRVLVWSMNCVYRCLSPGRVAYVLCCVPCARGRRHWFPSDSPISVCSPQRLQCLLCYAITVHPCRDDLIHVRWNISGSSRVRHSSYTQHVSTAVKIAAQGWLRMLNFVGQSLLHDDVNEYRYLFSDYLVNICLALGLDQYHDFQTNLIRILSVIRRKRIGSFNFPQLLFRPAPECRWTHIV